jgi:Bacterial membrane protein YfhO
VIVADALAEGDISFENDVEGHTSRRVSKLSRLIKFLPAFAASVWILLVALLLLAPAFAHGSMLGPYDLESTWGLGNVKGVSPYNLIASDQIRQMVPWTFLNWTEVHSGHLPIWNPYSGLGLPQLFNFQSAGLSLPMLVAYAFPVRFAYDILVIGKFVIAGTGILFFCRRVLGLGWVAAAFAGSVGELSGSFSSWAGWPMSGVLCWFGWILGAAVLVVRGPSRFRWTLLLAISVAFCIYGGHPESLLIMAVALMFPVLVVLVTEVRKHSLGKRGIAKVLGSLAGGSVCGIALAAPLLLPGATLAHNDVDLTRPVYSALPLKSAVNLALSGYYGFPLNDSAYFGPRNYYEMAAFVGVLTLMLGALAVVVRWRNPVVIGLVLGGICLFSLTYVSPLAGLIDHIPRVGLVYWNRALIPLDLVLAVLAGMGLDALLSSDNRRRVMRGFIFVVLLGTLAVVALAIRQSRAPTGGLRTTLRDESIEWAAVQALIALVAAALLILDHKRRRPIEVDVMSRWGVAKREIFKIVAVGLILAGTVAFLLTGTPNLWASSNTGFVATPAESILETAAAGQRVGFGQCQSIVTFSQLGIYPETNIAFGVDEFAVYDPILPKTFLSAYEALTRPQSDMKPGNFCPAINTASLARHFGVSLVLEPLNAKGPVGAIKDRTVANEDFYSIPGAGIVTMEPVGEPADSAEATVVKTTSTSPSSMRMVTDASTTSTLFIHIANFSGWSATIDGRPLKLRSWGTIEMAATVPAGRSTITLQYDPKAFRVGIDLAVLAVLAFIAVGVFFRFRSRRLESPGTPEDSGVGSVEGLRPTPEPTFTALTDSLRVRRPRGHPMHPR